MGRSAKVHKRAKKATAPSAAQTKTGAGTRSEQTATITAAKRKAGLKDKTGKRKPGLEGNVLGGADYVDLMMGGRQKARREAAKLPQDD
ncbi:hypothetical protein EW146_g2020 [Bondarzewia mesenterica]|uniref:Uncharacterized protein n=1 Tax=Bondarzewia mesenterica TaxID=1095465 RepID=A0A4S4M2H8_9AGAM|nr:hypothetical protein EW146_g2020 [Bondarzewia mesenterica]